MPLESLIVNTAGKKNIPPNFEFLTVAPSLLEIPELWNGNPKILDDGVVLFICQAGEAKIVIDMNTYSIQRGSFCLLLPFTAIQILEYSEDIKLTAITGGIEFLEKLTLLQPVEDYADLIQDNPCLLLNEVELENIKEIYNFTKNRLSDKNRPLAIEIRDTLLFLMALEVISLYAKLKPIQRRTLSRQEQIFRNFTFSLSKNFREHRDVAFYAKEACLTPRHFSTIVKKKSGKLPTQWIAERTIIITKFLLENSDIPVQKICNELNFPTQSFFSQYFKKHTGMTPKEYRIQKYFTTNSLK